ncbi:hypothetical protein [Halorussus sp. MSC15.2]|uniref:hypothetical protein n=1 Tax=Halorussus sp. MSC15.2 TaxID=2283638 RepID=UPI0013D44A22|nr:hypothetical protein [Halorussus sp. MSC15.2]NEU57166.1 hypothetical protein [Halorussus sp. MSC15.2]
MQRRPFLRLAVGAAATTAGCLGASGAFAGPTDATASDSDSTRMAAADGPSDAPTLSVSGVETFDYVVRLNDLGDDPTGAVTSAADLSDRERAVLRSAVAGTHRTRDPPEWLRRFASSTSFVERNGTYLRLDDNFPTYRVTAEAVPHGDVTGKVATYEEYERAVTREDYVASGLLRIAREEGIELSYVWPSLAAFFDAYDAARYHGEVVSFSVEVTDSGPPYELSATEVPVSAAVGGPVWNADAASERTRELLRRAGRTRGAYGFDRAPAGLLDELQSHEYVRLDGTFYTSVVEKRAPIPVSVSARVGNGRLRLALDNESDTALTLSGGAPRPFGVVRCRPTDTSNPSSGQTDRADSPDSSTDRLLWTDAYAASDHVRTKGRDVQLVEDVALTTTVDPGATVSETYAVPADLPPGEYAVEGSLGVREARGQRSADESSPTRSSTVGYRVSFTVA